MGACEERNSQSCWGVAGPKMGSLGQVIKTLESQVEDLGIGHERSFAFLEQLNDKVKVVFEEDS